jgi:hypothetical protein
MKTIFIIICAVIGIALLLFATIQVYFALTKKWDDEDVI